jgi:hypothetical protein
MENLEEIFKVIIGLVVGGLYLFGNRIFKNSEDEAPRPPNLPRESAAAADDDDDLTERQRQIQEAIRRKILERRQANESSAPAPTSTAEPISMHRERHKQVLEQQKKTAHRTAHPEPKAVVEEVDERFSWDASDNVYEEQMAARLKQIEATKRQAEALNRKSRAVSNGSKTTKSQPATTGGRLFSGSVRSTLRNPAAARTAFVYGEVLGKPVGLRASLREE